MNDLQNDHATLTRSIRPVSLLLPHPSLWGKGGSWVPLHTVPQTAFPKPRQGALPPAPPLANKSFALALSKAIIGTVLLMVMLVLAACGGSPTNTPTSTPTSSAATPTSTPQQTVTTGPGTTPTATSPSGYPIKVYFSKFPDSLNNFSAVFPVDRISPTSAVATFSIQLLIAGPTLSEHSSGYFSEFNSILSGPSSCSAPNPTGGPDFTLTLDMKGKIPEKGTATLQFCRGSQSPGIGTDARILSEIRATLKQFSNIKKVVVLTQAGNCFGDESGQNMCLK